MTTQRFYPYRNGADRIVLDVHSRDRLPKNSEGWVEAFTEPDVDPVDLQISVSVPDTLRDLVLDEKERSKPPVELLLVCKSVESRVRMTEALSGAGVYEKDLKLHRNDWIGDVELQVLMVRRTGNDAVDLGYATDVGARLAWSLPMRVQFDAPLQPPGGRIEPKWEFFEKSADPWRRSHSDNLFAVTVAPGVPELFVNQGVPHAQAILNSMGTHGRRARIRDATNYMIAHQAWTTLLASSFARLADAAHELSDATDPPDTNALLAELQDWQQAALKDWSRFLFPNVDRETATENLVDAVRHGDSGLLLSKLANCIQDRFRTYRGLLGLVMEGELL